jgi:hypothetical protein
MEKTREYYIGEGCDATFKTADQMQAHTVPQILLPSSLFPS